MNILKHSSNLLYKRIVHVFFIIILLFFLIFMTLGCDVIKSIAEQSSENPQEEITSIESENIDGPIEESNDINPEEVTEEKELEQVEEEIQTPEEYSIDINVYYIDEQAEFIVGEQRIITGIYTTDFIEAAFNELLKEPTTENIFSIIPMGTEILSSEFVDKIAFLNLNSDFVDNKWENGLIDNLVINSIASTMLEIPEVDGVLFNVDGDKLNNYGSLDISNPVFSCNIFNGVSIVCQ